MIRQALHTLLALSLLCATARTQQKAPTPLLPPKGFDDGHGLVLPGTEWVHATPESEGFSPARLEVLRAFLKTHPTDALMVVSRGHVVIEYGDLKLVSKVASVRKSVLDLLFAVEAQKGLKIYDLMDKSVVDLGLEDKTPFPRNRTTRHAATTDDVPFGNLYPKWQYGSG